MLSVASLKKLCLSQVYENIILYFFLVALQFQLLFLLSFQINFCVLCEVGAKALFSLICIYNCSSTICGKEFPFPHGIMLVPCCKPFDLFVVGSFLDSILFTDSFIYLYASYTLLKIFLKDIWVFYFWLLLIKPLCIFLYKFFLLILLNKMQQVSAIYFNTVCSPPTINRISFLSELFVLKESGYPDSQVIII